MEVNVLVSMCISKECTVVVEDCTPKNLYDEFMIQHGLPEGVSDYSDDNWCINKIEIIKNE